jgi:hypothetical protein
VSGVECPYHPNASAEFECVDCHRRFCSRCIKEVCGEARCESCKARLVRRQAQSEGRKRCLSALPRAGLSLIAIGTPCALALSLIEFTGGSLDMSAIGPMLLVTFTAGVGLLLFLVGVIFSGSIPRPLPTMVFGTVYVACFSGIISSWVQEEGFSALDESLLLLAPGLIPIGVGLTVWTARRVKGESTG